MKKMIAALVCSLSFGFILQVAAETASAPSSQFSPAEQSIAAANAEVRQKPTQFAGYNHLAIALLRRARETSDPTYYARAEAALNQSQALAPGNMESAKIHVWLLLGRDEFPAALEAATALNKKNPDDVLIYGFMADADIELGKYDDAEAAAQWMLNLRPGNLPSMIRTAKLRELFGDIDGAYEMLDLAYQATPPTETEDRAWILSQMGHLRFVAGNAEDAAHILGQALTTFPGYNDALGYLAQVRITQKRYDEAIALLQQRYKVAPLSKNLYDLAEALSIAGREDEAKKSFAQFEAMASAETSHNANANRDLVFYCADYAHQPSRALELAKQEISWRHDVYAIDAYAWALHVNGQNAEARKQIEIALAVGVRDASLLEHAGEIALQLGDKAAAAHYLQDSAASRSTGSEQARLLLANLAGTAASR